MDNLGKKRHNKVDFLKWILRVILLVLYAEKGIWYKLYVSGVRNNFFSR